MPAPDQPSDSGPSHAGAEACECDQHPLGARLIDWTCPIHGSFPGSFSADEVDRQARAEACECDQHPLGARLIDWTCPIHGSFPGSFSADEVDRQARAEHGSVRQVVIAAGLLTIIAFVAVFIVAADRGAATRQAKRECHALGEEYHYWQERERCVRYVR